MAKSRKRSRGRRSRGRGTRSPIVTRSVTRRRAAKKKRTPKMRMKSMAYILGSAPGGHKNRVAQVVGESRDGKKHAVRINGHKNRVAQVVGESRDGKKHAVRINYNGNLEIYNKEHLRAATAAEKKKDPKRHKREANLSPGQRERLNRAPLVMV